MWLILPVAAFFLVMGVFALTAPARVLGTFGVHVETPQGRAEVRAVYGGFGVAVGGVLLLALAADELQDGIYIAVAFGLAGMAAGRLLSALVGERLAVWPTWFFGVLELVLAGMLLAAAAM